MVGTGRFELPNRSCFALAPLARFDSYASAALLRIDLGVLAVGQFTIRP
jgi:hypothetical protein